MLDPFSSRFVIIKVEKYSFEEFKQVAMKVLNQVLECGSNSFYDALAIVALYNHSIFVIWPNP
jgi:N-acyl-L-homoserine lactone synthetase